MATTTTKDMVNTNALKKQITTLRKDNKKRPAMEKPISAMKRINQEKEVNYDINKKKVAKWINQVKKAREETQSDFTTKDKIAHGGGVVTNSIGQIASNVVGRAPASQLEAQIQAELKKQGLHTENDLITQEVDSVKNLDAAQLSERYQEIGKLKSLLFRQEMKKKRVKKIKSKLYHKLKRKDADREEKKLREYLEQVDPEAAQAYRDKEELAKVEERMRIRHGTETKFAKNLKRFKNMDDKQTRDAYHEAMRDK